MQKLQHTLRERRDLALRALTRYLPNARLSRIPEGGFRLWVELPSGVDDLLFVAAAARAGVSLTTGVPRLAAEKPGSFVLISTAGARGPDLETASLGLVASTYPGSRTHALTSALALALNVSKRYERSCIRKLGQ